MALMFALMLACVGCGKHKSEAAQLVDEKIKAIGTVSLDSKSDILVAENAYSKLTDEEKKQVEYYETLKNARETFDVLDKENNDALEIEQKQIKTSIVELINDNKSIDAKKQIEQVSDSNLKAELTKLFQDKCYDSVELFKFDLVVNKKPNKINEDNEDNYYYYKNSKDMEAAFDEYKAYLDVNASYIEYHDMLGILYNYEKDGKEVTLLMFTTSVDGYYLLQVSFDDL